MVETQEDFGSAGLPLVGGPLLDHLASRLRGKHQWHLKPLLRELTLSTAYRQTAQVDPGVLVKDPANRSLARGPRKRLTAEMVRDASLLAAGLLSRDVGGKPVMPPQPDGVWRTVYSGLSWNEDQGANRYRRGLYTYLRRTSPYPSFLSFDAPSREVCTPRRIATNTPLQALITLNDPVYHEAAAALARRFTGTPNHRIAAMYQAVTSHRISDPTLTVLLRLHDELSVDAGDPMATVAKVLLNTDEALTQ